LEDLTGVTFGTGNVVTALAFASTKGFVKYIGKREKHNSTMAIEVSENFTLRNHGINLVLYYNEAEELQAIDGLIDAEGLFVVVETNSGELEVWGVNRGKGANNFQNFGLKASALEGGSGTVITDSNIYTVSLNGNHENLQMYFKSGSSATLAQDIAVLDALVVWPAPPPAP